jgi:hypothetical protein
VPCRALQVERILRLKVKLARAWLLVSTLPLLVFSMSVFSSWFDLKPPAPPAVSFEAAWAEYLRTGAWFPVDVVVRLGVPTHLRREVWSSALGVGAAGAACFRSLLDKVDSSLDPEVKELVASDVRRMFTHAPPDYCERVKGEGLEQVLRALCVHDPEVGYCQGLNFIAGLLYYVLGPDPAEVFCALVSLLTRLDLRRTFSLGMRALTADVATVRELVGQEAPYLGKIFTLFDYDLTQVCARSLLTLFSGSWVQLGLENVLRLWDVMLVTGTGVVVRLVAEGVRALQVPLLARPPRSSCELIEVVTRVQADLRYTSHMLEAAVARAADPAQAKALSEVRSRQLALAVEKARHQHLVESQVRRGGRVSLVLW